MKDVSIHIRHATDQDAELIWRWRNATDVRAASRNPEVIPLEHHTRWFDTLLRNDKRELLIAETDGRPFGMVRLDSEGDYTEINIIVADHARGRGLAVPMLETALRSATNRPKIWMAIVKPDNPASIALFLRLGFREVSRSDLVTFELKSH